MMVLMKSLGRLTGLSSIFAFAFIFISLSQRKKVVVDLRRRQMF
jgi:hypothetical protein